MARQLIEFEQDGVKYLVMEVPGNAVNFQVWGYRLFAYEYQEVFKDVVLPDDHFEVIASLSGLTEEHAIEMVDDYLHGFYINYIDGFYEFYSATYSLKSRIHSLGGSEDANYVILKEVK